MPRGRGFLDGSPPRALRGRLETSPEPFLPEHPPERAARSWGSALPAPGAVPGRQCAVAAKPLLVLGQPLARVPAQIPRTSTRTWRSAHEDGDCRGLRQATPCWESIGRASLQRPLRPPRPALYSPGRSPLVLARGLSLAGLPRPSPSSDPVLAAYVGLWKYHLAFGSTPFPIMTRTKVQIM